MLLPAVNGPALAPVTAAGDLGHVFVPPGSLVFGAGCQTTYKKKMLMEAGADRGKAQRCIDLRPPRISLRLGSDLRTGNSMTGNLCAECETTTESPLRTVSS